MIKTCECCVCGSCKKCWCIGVLCKHQTCKQLKVKTKVLDLSIPHINSKNNKNPSSN